MKQIDAKPTEYRKQRNGRWVQNINKPLCRWMAVGGIAFMSFIAFHAAKNGSDPYAVPFGLVMGMAIGALLVLSLKSTDW